MSARRIAVMAMAALALVASPTHAQGGARKGMGRAAVLGEINLRFANQVMKEMGLSQEQAPRFRRIIKEWADKRSILEIEERRLRTALADEFRPGVAANPDSAAKFVDALNANRVDYASTFRDEMKELTPILTPVQRGQFQLRRDQLLQRVKEMQLQRPAASVPPS